MFALPSAGRLSQTQRRDLPHGEPHSPAPVHKISARMPSRNRFDAFELDEANALMCCISPGSPGISHRLLHLQCFVRLVAANREPAYQRGVCWTAYGDIGFDSESVLKTRVLAPCALRYRIDPRKPRLNREPSRGRGIASSQSTAPIALHHRACGRARQSSVATRPSSAAAKRCYACSRHGS
jgi:hypothetical protein